MSSKLERLVFSGREDDFLYFAEQFEARMHSLKLGKVFSGEATYLDYVPGVRNNSSEEQRRQAIEKGREELEEKKKTLWYELVQALDKTSVLFLRPHKGDGTRAWDVLCKRFKSFERPQLHKLIAQLTSLRKTSSESIVDYLTRADDMQYNLTLVNEGISEQMFVSIILKGLPKEYENFATLVKYSKDEKTLEEIKRDLINFNNENVKTKTESVFFNREWKCFNCQKMGHIAKECRFKKTIPEQTKASQMKFFKCGEHGHIAKFCRKQQKYEKRFVSQSRRTNQRGTQNLVEEQNLEEEEEEEEIFSFFQTSENNLANELVLDSGATSHMIRDESLFIDIDKEYSGTITNANSSKSSISGKGSVEIRVLDSNGLARKIRLINALLVPNNTRNLISVSKLRATGNEVVFGVTLEIRTKNGTVFPFEERDSLYIWHNIDYGEQCNLANGDPLSLWHKRLGHNNVEDIYKLKDHAVGLKVNEHDLANCEICQLNKSKKLPVPRDSGTRASEVLEIVHTDILGPIQPEAVDGHRYAIGFVDSFSRYQKLYFLRTRDEAFEKVEQFFADIGQPGTLVCDGAGEYVSNDIKQLCRRKGVRLEFSAPYTPQENGKVERNWGTITPMARCLLEQSGLEKEYWPYALNMASEIKKFCFHSGIQKTPFEAMYKKKPNLESIKVFGCSAFVHVEKNFRGKIDRTSQKGIFLGSSDNSKTYLVGTPNDKGIFKVRKSRNVTFNENEMFIEVKEKKEEIVNKHHSDGDRDLNPVAFLGEIVNNELLPKSIDEAIRDKNWYEAMKLEYNSLVENKVWELVENKGNKPIGSRWHFALKFGPSGEITRYKARFVAKGFSQVPSRDYNETYSPTTRLSTIGVLISYAVYKNTELKQMDIKTAYLNADIEE